MANTLVQCFVKHIQWNEVIPFVQIQTTLYLLIFKYTKIDTHILLAEFKRSQAVILYLNK